MQYEIVHAGESRSFPAPHTFLEQSTVDGEGLVYLGADAGAAYARGTGHEGRTFVAIELDMECLGFHTGESSGVEGSNVVGFARFRLGKADPSPLVELVRQPGTNREAIESAKAAFQASGLVVAVCNDFAGRIVDRLIRPYFNAALRRLDEKLASAADLDKTLCLGLGYPEGPISLLERTGLAQHYAVTQALYEALGQEAYAPARRARVAAERAKAGTP
ncbi:3-hydroxyacyl-CoA dehydrogenase family protein [Cupriavidus sp. UYPR2.512]|uniref:3-hydroxyacyl-CoA dehydrogenase family protein n=1 Tax=Cupriavidus sp. UYPR2.512 TaxID=1080187 RepID=UPI000373A586|nr:3-hydroxyacyl-CoA dehydrogenase family protein [Cupriavidus sp. UYPR2.512]UIF90040.1 3-hydroxyacyl-CoA dehydrogenase [Cupriavidus necator]